MSCARTGRLKAVRGLPLAARALATACAASLPESSACGGVGHKASHWLAYWDVFGRPATKPRYARGIPETWWYDRDKAATIDQ